MKSIKIAGSVLLIAFVGIQFVPTERNLSDSVPNTDFMVANEVPKNIGEELKVSCYNCHSNNTDYPWYNKIQPAAWYLEGHIKEAKAELNFNEWTKLSDRRKKSKLRGIINQIKDDEMPLDSYTLIHRDALLSNREKTEIIDFMTAIRDSLN